MAPKIQDYAVIGDGRSAALVSRGGAVDWLCWPRLDAPSLFGALLDPRAGTWTIAPAGPADVERQYVEGTNVLRTMFRTPDGVVTLTDFMPAASEEDKGRLLWPEHELLRRVECDVGEVELVVRYDPRPDYGRRRPRLRDGGALGLRFEMGPRLVALRGDVKLGPAPDGGAEARFGLRSGQRADFSLTCTAEGPAVVPPLGDFVTRKLDLAVDWWQRWARRARYDGPYRDAVVRSALVLKLLSYAPSGAIIAAPTTSLPERAGGDLNWDYRFCWLRDAAFTARALFGLGYREEAEAFVSWLLHATRLTLPKLQVLYDVYGERTPEETELPHLAGFAGSRPVRVGNATQDQLQLDVYGEVVEAVAHFVNSGGELDRETRTVLRRLGEFVCRYGRDPDHGIWEPRDQRRHFTHSRLMGWVALDRLLKLHAEGRLPGLDAAECAAKRDQIRRDIEERGWNPQQCCYVQTLGGATLDATVLSMPFYDFAAAGSPRMRQTYDRLVERLGAGPGLIYRYEQSFAGGEGAFGMCGFWLAEFLARGGGTLAEAHESLAHTLGYANDLGLFAEETDPHTGDALGNFPQGFTHVGLINAALALREAEEQRTEDRGQRGVIEYTASP